MPKINVYLPEDLATAVRQSGIPVSPVCQRALAEAVRAVERARKGLELLEKPGLDEPTLQKIGTRLWDRMTPRLKQVLDLASSAAGFKEISTAELLVAILDE